MKCVKEVEGVGKEFFTATTLEEQYILSMLEELGNLAEVNPEWDWVHFSLEAFDNWESYCVGFDGKIGDDELVYKEIKLVADKTRVNSDVPALERLFKYFEKKFGEEVCALSCTKRKGKWGRFKFLIA